MRDMQEPQSEGVSVRYSRWLIWYGVASLLLIPLLAVSCVSYRSDANAKRDQLDTVTSDYVAVKAELSTAIAQRDDEIEMLSEMRQWIEGEQAAIDRDAADADLDHDLASQLLNRTFGIGAHDAKLILDTVRYSDRISLQERQRDLDDLVRVVERLEQAYGIDAGTKPSIN